MSVTKIFIIAGESSGDVLGADLIRSMLAIRSDLEIRGIGGEKMLSAGLTESFFPMEELSVMGVAEILPKVPKFIGLIRKTVEAIRGFNPDVVVTIDSPDFSFRVQKKLREQKVPARRIHYVAPTVWAWRPGRARKIAQYLDGIICLFPFEVPYFEREGLSAISVGHPMVTSGVLEGDGLKFRQAHGFIVDDLVMGLFCGSRERELEMGVPIIKDVVSLLCHKYPELKFVIPTLPKWHARLEQEFQNLQVVVTSDSEEKYDAFRACDVAVAVSGTVALEIALSGIPHVLFYKMNSLTWEIVRRVVKTKFAHLGNILLRRNAYPEFIQQQVVAANISDVVSKFLSDRRGSRLKYQRLSEEVLEELCLHPHERASDIAANFVMK
ncbi:MAG: lipid-A-disaccharide synthase [Pseudobdellovibrionaceae bacterium]|jgi:lipid-A-disaccharide synthase|nr:lipid-A-disaccharide synthase [Pseudobdellovibrionaceae bacterium]